MQDAMRQGMDRLLKPRGVAVVGASQNPSYVTSILRNVRAYGFEGELCAVNPRYDRIGEIPCYPSLPEVPGVVDHVVVGVPERLVSGILADCERKGVGAVTIITSGFGETGELGTEKQRELAAWSARTGIRVVGPNCLGLMSLPGKLQAMPYYFEPARLKSGPFAFVLQSGQMGSCCVVPCLDRGIGVAYCITSGNEADVETADYIRYFLDDPEVRVIGCFTEQVKTPEKLIEVAELAADARKPIVMLKIGRTELSRRSAMAHTGSLVGSYATFEAVARRHGIALVSTIDELLETMAALLSRKLPRGRGVGSLLVSGGAAGMLADLAPQVGLEFPPLPAPTVERLKTVLPEFGSVGNPLDTTAMFIYQPSIWTGAVEALSAAENIDVILYSRGFPALADAESVVMKALQDAVDRHPEKVILVSSLVGGRLHETQNPSIQMARPVAELDGIPFLYGGTENVLRAVAALIRYAEFQRERARRRSAGATASSPTEATERARALVQAAGSRPLTEREGKEILALYGIATAPERLATTADEAVAAAEAIGYPVVLKIESPQITHKTEAGGVRLGIDSAEGVARAFAEIVASARRHNPAAEIAGVVVQEQVSGGQEVILGAARDPQYGPTVLVGLGGILVEVLKDTALRVPPLDEQEAREMLDGLRGRAILEGVRGRPPADVDALIDALVRFSRLAAHLGDLVEEIDVNPLVVLERGRGVRALDCLIVPCGVVAAGSEPVAAWA